MENQGLSQLHLPHELLHLLLRQGPQLHLQQVAIALLGVAMYATTWEKSYT